MVLPTYYVGLFYPDDIRERLEAIFHQVEFIDPDSMSEEESRRRRRELNPDTILTGWGAYSLADDERIGCDGLAYVCNTCGGIRNLVPRTLVEQGLIVTDWGSSISHTVAEGAMLLLLAAQRRLTETFVKVRAGQGWHEIKGRSLVRKRVGFHGFGRVARILLEFLKPFDVEVSVFAPGLPREVFAEFGVRRLEHLEALFGTNEIVIELEALTPENEGIISADLLRRLPEGGVFVNVARAGLVDEASLIEVAREGRIQFGLDVFHVEPLPLDSPLLQLPNVTITPHNAGPTPDTLSLCGEHALANLHQWVRGKPLDAVIDLARYDTMT